MSQKKKIIFRANSSPETGMGHISRCLALAEMLNEKYTCSLVSNTHPATLSEEVNSVFSNTMYFEQSGENDQDFQESLTENDIVVLDGYNFDTNYQKNIKAKGALLVCIDDLAEMHFVADAVINHAGIANMAMYSTEPYTRLYLGLDYAIIRKAFLENNNDSSEKEYDILVLLGASQQDGLLNKILNSALNSGPDYKIAVVSNSQTSQALWKNVTNVEFFSRLNAAQVSRLMLRSRIGILPSSTVSIEAVACRLPFISGYLVDNQFYIYKSLESKGLAKCIGDLRTLERGELLSGIADLLSNESSSHNIISNQEKALDKRSANRLIEVFDDLSGMMDIKLRKAGPADMDLIYSWNNEPSVRANSFNTDPISPEEHRQWFHRKMADPAFFLYIFEDNRQNIGLVKIDKGPNTIIGVTIPEEQRGKGYSAKILRLAINEFWKYHDEDILAYIKTENLISIKTFTRCGFVFLRKEKFKDQESVILKISKYENRTSRS